MVAMQVQLIVSQELERFAAWYEADIERKYSGKANYFLSGSETIYSSSAAIWERGVQARLARARAPVCRPGLISAIQER
jgi:hypothetical protein